MNPNVFEMALHGHFFLIQIVQALRMVLLFYAVLCQENGTNILSILVQW